MKDEQQIGLNYFGFLSTPPTSSRTEANNIQTGSYAGYTTRRSLTKSPHTTFNGTYEGDFTMFDENIKSPRSNYNQPIMADQYIGDTLDLGFEQQEDQLDADVDEIVDEEIRGKSIQLEQSEKKVSSFWKQYKNYIFNPEQCEKIDNVLEKIQSNTIYRKVSFTIRCATVLSMWILHLLFCSVVMRVVDACCTPLRSRNLLRSGTRRMLWFMTLAKCDDLPLYGLIMLISPLLFLVAFLGFIVALYCAFKNGICALIGHVRYRLDVEPPNFN